MQSDVREEIRSEVLHIFQEMRREGMLGRLHAVKQKDWKPNNSS